MKLKTKPGSDGKLLSVVCFLRCYSKHIICCNQNPLYYLLTYSSILIITSEIPIIKMICHCNAILLHK